MHPIFPTDSEGNIKIKSIGHVKLTDTPRTGGPTMIEAEIPAWFTGHEVTGQT